MNLAGFVDLLAAFLEGALDRKVPKLVIQSHGFAPMGDRALRFACGRFREGLLGFLVLKRVQQRDALFDGGRDGARASRGEMHFAKLVGRRGGQARLAEQEENNG